VVQCGAKGADKHTHRQQGSYEVHF